MLKVAGDLCQPLAKFENPIIALIRLLHVKFSSINTPRDLVKFTLYHCVPLISKAGIADRLFNFV